MHPQNRGFDFLDRLDIQSSSARTTLLRRARCGALVDAETIRARVSDRLIGHQVHHQLERADPRPFATANCTSSMPVGRATLERVRRKLPVDVLRRKGFVALADDEDRRRVVQVVGRSVRLRPGGPWCNSGHHSVLVAIGSLFGLDQTAATLAQLGFNSAAR